MPVSPFPQEFATAILQLKQQREQQDAQLAEMRRARDLEEQTARTRQAALEQETALRRDELNFRTETFKAEQASQAKALEIREQDNIKREEKEREAQLLAGLTDFANKGTAFIPTAGTGEFAKLRKSFEDAGDAIHVTPIPGLGLFAQRLTGEHAQKLKQFQLDNEKTEAEIALAKARADQVRNKINLDTQRANGLIGQVSARDIQSVGDTLDALRKDALAKAGILQASDKPEDMARAAEINRDWRVAFDEKSPERSAIDNLNVVLQSWSEGLKKGVQPPSVSSNTALDLAGVKDHVNAAVAGTLIPKAAAAPAAAKPAAAPSQPAVRVSGRFTPHAPGSATAKASDTVYVLQDGTQVTTSDIDRFKEIARKGNSGEISKDSPEYQQAKAVVLAIMSYQSTYAQPSWITNE